MSEVIKDIIELLDTVEIEDASYYDIADTLWLYSVMTKKKETPPSKIQNNKLPAEYNDTEANNNTVDEFKEKTDKKKGIPLYIDTANSTNKPKTLSTSTYTRLPTPKQFKQFNQFAKAYRPLKQRVPSKTEFNFDEEATVDYIANSNLFTVIKKPKQELKYTLSILIEKSESMQIWEELAKDFVLALRRFSFAKKINLYYCSLDDDQYGLYKDYKCQNRVSSKVLRHPYEKRYLTILLSDCISRGWGDMRGYNFLEELTNYTPFKIINMLPRRIWRRTVLGKSWRIKYTHNNRWLNNFLVSDIDESKIKKHLRVPIVNLDGIPLKHWSNLIIGKKENWVSGSIFEADVFSIPYILKPTPQKDNIDAYDLVKSFYTYTSPTARKLAIFFSAIDPLTMDIMKIIQKESLPNSDHTHLAEVFLSGLLKKRLETTKVGETVYSFRDGVREILVEKLSPYKREEIIERNSNFIIKNLGSTIDFPALMKNSNPHHSSFGFPLDENAESFAHILADYLDGKGDEYFDVSSKLRGKDEEIKEEKLSENIEEESKKVDKPDPTPVGDGLIPAQMDVEASHQSDEEIEAPDEIDSDEEDIIPESELEDNSNDLPTVDINDIKYKKGNYLFTVGNIGSGKSTLLSRLLHRLWHKEDIRLDYNSDDELQNETLDKMKTLIENGFLPKRGVSGVVQEFNIAFQQENKAKLDLNFLEIAGEDIESIVPSIDSKVKQGLILELDTYLRLDSINKKFIFVSDAEENRRKSSLRSNKQKEEFLFNHLLQYLLGRRGLNMKKIDILFVVNKWDIVEHEYSSVEEYMDINFKAIRAKLKSNSCNTVYIPLSIGEIKDVKQGNHFVKKITELEDGQYIDMLIHWIYHSYTNRLLDGFPKIVPTLGDRFSKFFK